MSHNEQPRGHVSQADEHERRLWCGVTTSYLRIYPEEIEQMRGSMGGLLQAGSGTLLVSEFHQPNTPSGASAWGKDSAREALDHFTIADARLNRLLVQARFVSSITEARKLIKVPNSGLGDKIPEERETTVTGPAPAGTG